MCTAIVHVDPGSVVPVLVVGVRDEFVARSWEAPRAYWGDRPSVVGGRDLRAGGTWLAVEPGAPRVATVLNGRGRLADEAVRVSRGELPLVAASEGKLGELDLRGFDPFHLLVAEPGRVRLWSWDGAEVSERELGAGLHMIVNSGLEGEGQLEGATEDAYMAARLDYFRPRLEAVGRPSPGFGDPVDVAWGEWLPLLNGGGLPRADHRALLPLLDLGDGRVWGTTSVSLVALGRDGVRYDFSAAPGDAGAWTRVL
ncbi:NRDE family protein [Actinomadura decatromicini]|uniref:NRDE family protein n=1 Tax=Actinomadura decatromicini TaxID=2604572 RepID=A0A5D3FDF2_9ACTN|nr:NRDE family protein [Actinomadura decatromicini]TYK45295.1 NRDE family protein [Actinomadura decatromicini]